MNRATLTPEDAKLAEACLRAAGFIRAGKAELARGVLRKAGLQFEEMKPKDNNLRHT